MTRKLNHIVFTLLIYGAVAVCVSVLVFLFGVIVWKGASSISLEFMATESSSFGASGGILYQIIGSVLLVLTAGLISFPLGLGVAITKSEYIKSARWQRVSNLFLYGLNAVPSILFGVFGLVFFVNFLDTGVSWFVGVIVLAIMILPAVTLSAYQSLNSIPSAYRESSLALGFTRWEMIRSVLLPQGINGAVTGLMIGLSRAIGETAPIMFIATAFSGVTIPTSLLEPVASLPTHILALAQQATDKQALANAWGTSFVLILLVISFSVSALLLRLRFKSMKAA